MEGYAFSDCCARAHWGSAAARPWASLSCVAGKTGCDGVAGSSSAEAVSLHKYNWLQSDKSLFCGLQNE